MLSLAESRAKHVASKGLDPARVVAIDTETTGILLRQGCRAFAISLAWITGETLYAEYPVDPTTRQPVYNAKSLALVRKHIDRAEAVVMHNAKFDVLALALAGIEPDYWPKVHDTMLLAHATDSDRGDTGLALKPLALRHLDILDDDERDLKREVDRARLTILRHPDEYPGWQIYGRNDPRKAGSSDYWLPKALNPKSTVCQDYAVRDAERTIKLYFRLVANLLEQGLYEQYERERQLLATTFRMETAGVLLHTDRMDSETEAFSQLRGKASKALARLASSRLVGNDAFNPQSQPQLTNLFTAVGVQSPKTTEKGSPSYDKEALKAAKELHAEDSPAWKAIDHYQAFQRAKTTMNYINQYNTLKVRHEHRCGPNIVTPLYKLHPSLKIVGTGTTRFSCENPNGQNIGKGDKKTGERNLRALFGPSPGHVWYDYDYSNIEFRLFAWESGDKELIGAFERGESMHLVIARILWGDQLTKDDPEYNWTKNGNFALIYGAGEATADAAYHQPGAYARIRKMLPSIPAYTQRMGSFASKYGYVDTLTGYRLTVPRGVAHKAVSYRIQGTAGSVMKLGMLAVDEYLTKRRSKPYRKLHDDVEKINDYVKPFQDAYPVLTIHDQLVIEAEEDLPLGTVGFIKDCLESPGKLIGIPTPTECKLIRKVWSEPTELDLTT